jgi:hypothetical protein
MSRKKRRARKPRVTRERARRDHPEDDEDETIDPNLLGFEDKEG